MCPPAIPFEVAQHAADTRHRARSSEAAGAVPRYPTISVAVHRQNISARRPFHRSSAKLPPVVCSKSAFSFLRASS
jgi:hypothetical protein